MITEKTLKRGLVKALKDVAPEAVVFSHAERIRVGVPDLSVTVNGRTVWLELKRDRSLNSLKVETGIQVITARRLALQGACYYVLYGHDSTQVISPIDWSIVLHATRASGHRAVAEWLKTGDWSGL